MALFCAPEAGHGKAFGSVSSPGTPVHVCSHRHLCGTFLAGRCVVGNVSAHLLLRHCWGGADMSDAGLVWRGAAPGVPEGSAARPTATQRGNPQRLCRAHGRLGSHCTVCRNKIKYFTFLEGLTAGVGCVGSPSSHGNGERCGRKVTSLKIVFPPKGRRTAWPPASLPTGIPAYGVNPYQSL